MSTRRSNNQPAMVPMAPVEPQRTNAERFAEMEARLDKQGEEIDNLNEAVAKLIRVISSAKKEHQAAQAALADRSKIIVASR